MPRGCSDTPVGHSAWGQPMTIAPPRCGCDLPYSCRSAKETGARRERRRVFVVGRWSSEWWLSRRARGRRVRVRTRDSPNETQSCGCSYRSIQVGTDGQQ